MKRPRRVRARPEVQTKKNKAHASVSTFPLAHQVDLDDLDLTDVRAMWWRWRRHGFPMPLETDVILIRGGRRG